jgi:hypothetical protein
VVVSAEASVVVGASAAVERVAVGNKKMTNSPQLEGPGVRPNLCYYRGH